MQVLCVVTEVGTHLAEYRAIKLLAETNRPEWARPFKDCVPGGFALDCGFEDRMEAPTAEQQDMATRLNAERTCIPAAAHNPNVEAPATTAHALTTFWNAAER